MVIQAARSTNLDEVADIEEHQGEPVSAFYTYENNAMIFIDSAWSIPSSATGGLLTIGYDVACLPTIRGAVLKVQDYHQQTLAQADPAMLALYGTMKLQARWVRLSKPPSSNLPATILEEAVKATTRVKQGIKNTVGNQYNAEITALVFPEEGTWRRMSDGWIFVVRQGGIDKRGRQDRASRQKWYLARAGRAGRQDLGTRVPLLHPLRERRIAVIGLGAVGAPSAIEFARAGVAELRLLDRDVVDPAQTVRWPFGLSVAGMEKAAALTFFITTNYPYTKVHGIQQHIGAFGDMPSDITVLGNLLDGVDLLYDATAEIGIQQALSEVAAEAGIPYICISATAGAWGGIVAQVQGDRSRGCWYCLQHGLDKGHIPSPPQDVTGTVQPQGCASPTFTGTSFDLNEVSLMGVRMAVGMLRAESAGAHPRIDHDVMVLSLRDSTGDASIPTWQTYGLKDPACPVCGRR